MSCIGGTRSCASVPVYRTAVGGDDSFQINGRNITAGLNANLPIEPGYLKGELKAGETIKVEFNIFVK